MNAHSSPAHTPSNPKPTKPVKPLVANPLGVAGKLPNPLEAREIFWQNVMREMLTSLAMQRAKLVSTLNEELKSVQLEKAQQQAGQTDQAEQSQTMSIAGATIAGPAVGAPSAAKTTDSSSKSNPPAEAEGDGESDEHLSPAEIRASMAARMLEQFDGRMAIVTSLGERIPIADITPLFACSIGNSSRTRALSEDVQCTVFQVRTPSGEVYTFPIQEIRGLHALTAEAMEELKAQAQEGESGDHARPFGFAAFTSLARELESEDQDETEPGSDPISTAHPYKQ